MPGSEPGPPDHDIAEEFAASLRDAPTDERVYRVALELTEPATVGEIAEMAECSKNAARRHLDRLAEIGVLTKLTENPDVFERNEAYFRWKRRHRLSQLSSDEYVDRMGALITRSTEFKDKYGVEEPDDLDPLSPPDGVDPEEVWGDIRTWKAVIREFHELRLAQADRSVDEEAV